MDSLELKEKIKEHYNIVTPYYNSLWGKHIHHGYWITGKESKEVAQDNLVEKLIKEGEVKLNSKILDVGCGVGASSIYFAKNLNSEVVGITISPIQQAIAENSAKENGVNFKTRFLVMDAENISLNENFDYIWSVEAISHFPNKDKFFTDAIKLLNIDGRVVLIDWFIRENLTVAEDKKYIDPIRKGMLVPDISTMERYKQILIKNNCRIISEGDISKETAKTWDISLEIIRNPKFWLLAIKQGKEFVQFLRSFKAMRDGFSSGMFIYGYIVAEKLG